MACVADSLSKSQPTPYRFRVTPVIFHHKNPKKNKHSDYTLLKMVNDYPRIIVELIVTDIQGAHQTHRAQLLHEVAVSEVRNKVIAAYGNYSCCHIFVLNICRMPYSVQFCISRKYGFTFSFINIFNGKSSINSSIVSLVGGVSILLQDFQNANRLPLLTLGGSG